MNKCVNCIYSRFQTTDKGNIKRSVSGKCEYKVDTDTIMKMLPDAVTSSYYFDKSKFDSRNAIWYNTESNCPVFKSKN